MLASGGEIEVIIRPEGERLYWYPQILPGGRLALFTAAERAANRGDLMSVDLETGEVRTILTDAVGGRYIATGHVVFLRVSAVTE